jgi:tetratricopeptide (TPR) repeat protein
MKKTFLVCFSLVLALTLFGQNDYPSRYNNAKSLFKEGKYNLAMESFKPLIAYDQNNQYAEYASFYYALSAYHQGFYAVAKDMLNQIKALYPKWDKLPEVNFWQAKIHFDNHDYFQGLKILSTIDDKKFEKDIDALKTHHLAGITDTETLKMMFEEYPKDAIIAKSLATALSKNVSSPEDKKQLEELVEKFKFKKSDFIPEAPKTVHKERYAVSVLFPFMANTLEPTPGRKRNQIVLDFYEGMKMAVDSLSHDKVSISLRAYDTERSVEKIKRLLETEEFKNTDVIVGPFFPEENKVVQDFSERQKVNTIHPFSNSTDIIGVNPHAFLFQPAAETLGRKAAEYLAVHDKEKRCMVFYGTGKKDSVMAANFTHVARESGMKVLTTQKISNKETQKITDILATPTEFDEFRYPKQFTLMKDSLSSIFVASDDPLIYTKVVGAVETRGDSVKVIGSENWLDDNAIDLEKYEVLKIVLTSPNFVAMNNPNYRKFENKFINLHGRPVSNVARMGYEFMLFLGQQLKTNGVYFQQGLNEAGILQGYLSQGFNYANSRDNQVVPFITFKKGELILVEKR